MGAILFAAYGMLACGPVALLAPGSIGQPDTKPPVQEAVLPADPRAIWVVRDALTSPSGIRRMVDAAAEAGITDLFVQVRGRGDAYYPSKLVTIASPLRRAWKRHGPFDPLELVIERARETGLRVHAWLNVYLVWGKGTPPEDHVIRLHPEWVAVDGRGVSMRDVAFQSLIDQETEGVYLEPGNRRVVQDFLKVVRELLERYPLDGIHLDYVRYPNLDVGYSPAMRAGFRRRTGIDPLELRNNRSGLIEERGGQGLMDLEREWQTFKANQVSALVWTVRRLTREIRPEVLLSAAVKPDPVRARQENGQHWVRWVNEGFVDFVVPMMYSKTRSTVRRQAKLVVEVVPPERVWAGIAVYNQSLDSAAGKIQTVREAGIEGISIFSYNSLPGGPGSLKRLNQAR